MLVMTLEVTSNSNDETKQTKFINLIDHVEWVPSQYHVIEKAVRNTVKIPVIDRCYMPKQLFTGEIDNHTNINNIISKVIDGCYKKRG